LSIQILKKYGSAIGYDFSEHIPGMDQFTVEEEGSAYKKEPTTIEEALRERDEWRNQYYALMDKYVKIIKES
jgi:hypothetical protein